MDIGRGEERVRCMDKVTWKLTWLRKLKQGLCIKLEGWSGEGDGREVQKGGDIWEGIYLCLIHVEV